MTGMTMRAGTAWNWRLWWQGLLLLLLLGGLHSAQARDSGVTGVSEQGLLWQVSSTSTGKTSYLFATIHSEDTRVTTLAPAVQSAFNHSSRYVMEILPDQATMLAASQAMLLEQGSSLHDIVGSTLFEKAARVLGGMGVPPEVADRFKPWAAMVIMSMPKLETGQVLDLMLYSAAIRAGKAQYGLESAMEQLSVFDNLSMPEQKTLLEEAVNNYPQMQGMMEQMHIAYLSRDLSRLSALSDQYSSEGDARLASKINNSLIDQRNQRMAERMETYLHQGGAFVAVGALHLPGEHGLLQLLRKRGYVVTAIY